MALRVHHDQNVAMIIDPVPGNRSIPFNYGYTFSPRVWLGTQRVQGVSFRASYWYFEDRADRETATSVVGSTPIYLFVYGAGDNLTRNAYADLGETLSSVHRTRLQTLDFELMDTINCANWCWLPSAGLRLAEIDQDLRGDVYNAGGILQETVTNELNLLAAGPTMAVVANRRLDQTPWAFYGKARGSLLFSRTRQEIYEMKNTGADQVRDRAYQNEIISVFEMGLGIQHGRIWSNGLVTTIAAGYELQAWRDVGGPVDSNSTLGLDGLTSRIALCF